MPNQTHRDAAIAALTIAEIDGCANFTPLMRDVLIRKIMRKNAEFFPEAKGLWQPISVNPSTIGDYLVARTSPESESLNFLVVGLCFYGEHGWARNAEGGTHWMVIPELAAQEPIRDFNAAPPSEKEAQVYKHSIFSDRIERVMGEKEAPATPCTTCGQPMRLGLAVCLNVKCALTGVLMAAAPSSVDLHAEQRRRVHQYEDRIPCGKCGHVHLGICSICNNCEQIEPPQMHAEQREYEKKFGPRPPADGEWPTSQFFAPMIWDYRREGWMARAEQGLTTSVSSDTFQSNGENDKSS